jgi:hypothetical protein
MEGYPHAPFDNFSSQLDLAFTERLTGIRKQGNVAGALNRSCQIALVLGAGSGLPAWANLSIFGYKTAQQVNLLVIDYRIFIGAELANFRTG